MLMKKINRSTAPTYGCKAQREAGSVDWFLTRNIMMKAEYVNQVYMGYLSNNILNGGRFNGVSLEASIAF